MTGPRSGTFRSTLEAVERRLVAPIPRRVRILRELEADLEALYAELRAEGLPDAEARRRSIEALAPDGPALLELGRIHRPLYRRLTGGLSDRRLRVIERSVLATATLVVLGSFAGALLRVNLLYAPSRFMVPVIALGEALRESGLSVP